MNDKMGFEVLAKDERLGPESRSLQFLPKWQEDELPSIYSEWEQE